MGTISAKARTLVDPKHLKKAAKKLASQGWWFEDEPICPKCHKKKITQKQRQKDAESPTPKG
jgi:hypothetical protein